MKHNNIALLSLVLAVFLLVITGCSSAKTTTPGTVPATTTKAVSPFTQAQLQKIVADAAAAMKTVTVYKMAMDISTSVSTDGAAAVVQAVKGTISYDQPLKQMTMDAELTVDDGRGSKETQSVSLYVLTDYVYLKAVVPDVGEQWVKTAADPEILQSFDANIAQEQIDVLEAPASIEWVGYATISGAECYVVKIRPNETYLRNYAQEQTNDTLDWNKISSVNDIFKDIWYEAFIVKDTFYVQQMTFKGVIEITGDMMSATSNVRDFKTMVTDMDGTIGMSPCPPAPKALSRWTRACYWENKQQLI
jgi:hypothetical protein